MRLHGPAKFLVDRSDDAALPARRQSEQPFRRSVTLAAALQNIGADDSSRHGSPPTRIQRQDVFLKAHPVFGSLASIRLVSFPIRLASFQVFEFSEETGILGLNSNPPFNLSKLFIIGS